MEQSGRKRGRFALLQARAVRPLALGSDQRVRQPDRRHQIATGELGQHPRVDPVGLAGQRCQPLHLLRVETGLMVLFGLRVAATLSRPSSAHTTVGRPATLRPSPRSSVDRAEVS